jgi:serine/threonine-protein kinase RsbW
MSVIDTATETVDKATVELRFAALPGHVRTARMIATALARRVGVPSGALEEIRLAVGEACLRAVNVNHHRAPDDLVEVTMTNTLGVFTVSVTDSGEPGDDATPGPDGGPLGLLTLLGSAMRDPVATPGAEDASLPGDADPAATGSALPPGIGLALIEGLVDDVAVRRRPEGVGTIVTMTWDHTLLYDAGIDD